VTANLAALLYLVASVCFILALKGLSSPETARRGNLYGISGMVIAVGTTLASPGVLSYGVIFAGIVIGGAIGTYIALKIRMTALPQLIAAFHSLVGLAAVCVATAAFYSPADYGIGAAGAIYRGSLVEMGLGTAIGAITFTGSIVAFAKLQGLVTGAPLMFPMQHPLNALLGILIVVVGAWFAMSGDTGAFWVLMAVMAAILASMIWWFRRNDLL
jgi:NAD(P) transhydrogenase subunit beta